MRKNNMYAYLFIYFTSDTEDREYDFGKRKKRHGGVIGISDKKYKHLVEFLGG